MTEGVDYSTARPAPAGLWQAGKRFAVRYGGAGTRDKWLSPSEAASLAAAGLAIVANVEGAANGLLGGYSTGRAWAINAHEHFVSCGMPADRPIYFSVDWDIGSSQWAAVKEALRGAADVLGLGRVGVYGGRRAISLARGAQAATWFWQTYAWSGSPTTWVEGNHIEQYRNGVTIAGGDCDLNRALRSDYGQWQPGKAAASMDTGEHIIQAWSQGNDRTPNGTGVAPVTWQIRREVYEVRMESKVDALLARPAVVLSDVQLDAIREAVQESIEGVIVDVLARVGLTVAPRG